MNKLIRAIRMPKKRLVKKLLGAKEIYAIGYRKISSQGRLYECSDSSRVCFSELFSNKNSWYADPILFKNNKTICLFVEKFDYKKQKGEIACSLFNGKSFDVPVTIINEPFHLSFPTVFSVGDDIYMIPETSEDLSIRIYKSYNFPFGWRLFKRIDLNFEVVDSIVIDKTDGGITFLCSKINKKNPLTCCYFVYKICFLSSNDIDFQIIKDNENYNLFDRLAGSGLNLDLYKNQLLVPTQESTSIDYGVNINFKLLQQDLSFLETYSKKITPNSIEIKGIDSDSYVGIHSYAALDDIEIIDIRYLTTCIF